MWFAVFVGGALFLFGLVQWARSGAILWDIRHLLKNHPVEEFVVRRRETPAPRMGIDGDAPIVVERDDESRKRDFVRRSMREMESLFDGLLRSSFRVLGVLALCVWLFVMLSVALDVLELDWMDRLSFTANRILGNPIVRARGPVTTGTAGARRGANPNSNFMRQLRSSPSRR